MEKAPLEKRLLPPKESQSGKLAEKIVFIGKEENKAETSKEKHLSNESRNLLKIKVC